MEAADRMLEARFRETPAESLGVPRSTLYDLMRKSTNVRAATDIDADEIRRARDECGGDLTAMARRLRVSRRGLALRMRGRKHGDA